ncbi:MAG: DNA polymerase Y family protein [Betaproteobacteria bacterium]
MSAHWIALRLGDAALATTPAPSDPLTALAWRVLQVTPWVAQVDDALVFDISASERLFGGRTALLEHLGLFGPHTGAVCCAQGATSLLALGRLACVPSGTCAPFPLRAPGMAPEIAADALPLHALASARAHLPTLERLGCHTWGQLRSLPRGGLARRLGADVLAALDQAYGLRPDLYPWIRLPEVFDAPLELAAQVESAPALLFGARRLLAQLLAWLRARQLGVQRLELRWELDARRSNAQHLDAHHQGSDHGSLELHTAQATQDMRHLERLLGEQLARVRLPAPVLYLRLRSLATQALPTESQSLLTDSVRSGDSLHQMLERVSARCGPAQVLCAQVYTDHRPECMQQWQAWSGQPPAVQPRHKRAEAVRAADAAGALYPTWLLANPQRLLSQRSGPQFHGPMTLLAGPQRLEAGWLAGESGVLRDYFVAHSAHHGLLWIYRQRLGSGTPDGTQDWYLHGYFA